MLEIFPIVRSPGLQFDIFIERSKQDFGTAIIKSAGMQRRIGVIGLSRRGVARIPEGGVAPAISAPSVADLPEAYALSSRE